jgi:hypothetical protein
MFDKHMELAQRSAFALLALFGASTLASAASDGARAPVDGALKLDRARATPGQVVTAQLRITALSDIPMLRMKISSIDHCAAQLADAKPALVRKVKRGGVVAASARFRVTGGAPCHMVAQVVSSEGVGYRFGSLFQATINPGPAPHDNSTPGTTADGRPTADFQSRPR